MRFLMKKSLAIVLAMTFVFSCIGVMAYAADTDCDCEHCPSIVIPGIFQSKVRYLDVQNIYSKKD